METSLFLIISLIILTSACDTISQLFLKSSINSIDGISISTLNTLFRFIFKLISIPRVWLGLIFSTLSLCIWLMVLSKADLNFAFSVDSMHYIFIALASKIFLKEKVGTKRWAGTLCIVAGIILVTLTK